jgi:hypothetical protein
MIFSFGSFGTFELYLYSIDADTGTEVNAAQIKTLTSVVDVSRYFKICEDSNANGLYLATRLDFVFSIHYYDIKSNKVTKEFTGDPNTNMADFLFINGMAFLAGNEMNND